MHPENKEIFQLQINNTTIKQQIKFARRHTEAVNKTIFWVPCQLFVYMAIF